MFRGRGDTYGACGAQHQYVWDSGKLAQTPPETPAAGWSVCVSEEERPQEEKDTPGRQVLTTALHGAVVGRAGRHVGDLRAGHLVLP